MLSLLFLFTVVPALELYFLIQAGQSIGVFNTVLIVIATGILGAYFAKKEGRAIVTSLNEKMQRGEMPADKIIEGVLVLIGGVLLVTPGFFTDFLGLSFVFPITRKIIVLIYKEKIKSKIQSGHFEFHSNTPPGGFGSTGSAFTYSSQETHTIRPNTIKDAKDVTPKTED